MDAAREALDNQGNLVLTYVTMVPDGGPAGLRPLDSPTDGGLLTRFIREKLAQHVEPTRLGTPRGAPIGFSRKKMTAALFALTSADVKQTAKEIRVSYGLVRKWRTEAAFKRLVERLEDDFVERFCAAVDSDLGGLAPVPDTPGETGASGRAAPRADLGDLGGLAPGAGHTRRDRGITTSGAAG